MGLVDYSSEDSGAEDSPAPKTTAPQTAQSQRPAFQKVVDKTAPTKIRVNLPNPSAAGTAASKDDSEPPAKRPKLGAGGGFNSFLPAAKKPVATPQGQTASSRARGRGLGSGISLKTGSEAAFSREPMPPPQPEQSEEPAHQSINNGSSIDLPAPVLATAAATGTIPPKGKTTMFKPLSVSRKPPKKKIAAASAPPGTGTNPPSAANSALQATEKPPAPKPSISLFSMSATDDTTEPAQPTAGEYQPFLHEPSDSAYAAPSEQLYATSYEAQTSATDPSSLGAIADDLNLTASQRRQLFGRGGKGAAVGNPAAVMNVVNFNTDAEYAANEELRAAGEQPEQQHKAVRTINASGKNSLRSLVSSAANNAEALEEHFAKGKRNQREAGSKYGW